MIRRLFAILLTLVSVPVQAEGVRIKDMGRFLGWRDNPLVGYGLVTGLAGSGDSPRSEITRQALKNALGRLGANVPIDQLQSRNVAAVMVTATLPPSANVGDRIDVTVSSIGDARSLAGGTLLMTPLQGPDQHDYALAQGAVVVGGYRFDSNQSSQQKNYPTAGTLSGGATVEASVPADLAADHGMLTFILKDPDFTTAERIAQAVNLSLGSGSATVRGADAVRIRSTAWAGGTNGLIARIEGVTIDPDERARVVINERSGTVVAGGRVQISSVVISQGDVKVSVSIDNQAAQAPLYLGAGSTYTGLVVTNTKIDVAETHDATIRLPNTTVTDLVQGLNKAHVNTRSMIAIMQAMKAAGALHADIIVQ
jgi:flagellar P-ring protein precursor FlgI